MSIRRISDKIKQLVSDAVSTFVLLFTPYILISLSPCGYHGHRSYREILARRAERFIALPPLMWIGMTDSGMACIFIDTSTPLGVSPFSS